MDGWKDGSVLFNNVLNTIYLRLYGVRHMVKDLSNRTTQRGNRCRHMGYSFRYASSHRQDNTYHGLCYTSRGELAGTRNSSMGPPWRIDQTTHRTLSERSYHGATSGSQRERFGTTIMCQVLNCIITHNERKGRREFPQGNLDAISNDSAKDNSFRLFNWEISPQCCCAPVYSAECRLRKPYVMIRD